MYVAGVDDTLSRSVAAVSGGQVKSLGVNEPNVDELCVLVTDASRSPCRNASLTTLPNGQLGISAQLYRTLTPTTAAVPALIG